MSDEQKKKLKVLYGKYKSDDAMWIIGKRTKNMKLTNINIIFYPYDKLIYLIDMGEKLKRLNDRVMVMLDLYTGRMSFASKPGKYVDLDVEIKYIMPAKVDKEVRKREIRLDIANEVMGRKRVLKTPKLTLESEEIVYKPFYIVECINEEDEAIHILFDPVTAHYSLINA